MRTTLVVCLALATTAASASECRLRGAPWLEGRVASTRANATRAQ